MKKNLIKMLATFSLSVILFISNSTISLAYTQDDCKAAWDELDKKNGINSDDCYVGGRTSRNHIL